MSDEFDTAMDTSFEDTGADVSPSAELDASPDVGGEMDSTADTGDLFDASSDIGSLMDEPSNMESTMDDMDAVEAYEAVPNSDIPILQEDGTVDSLENIMAENAETEEIDQSGDSFDEGISDVTDEGDADSLDAIMRENAEDDSAELEQIEIQAEPALDAADTPQEEIVLPDEGTDTAEDTATDAGDIGDVPDEPLHMTQSDVEWYLENANDAESLRQMRDGITSGRIRIDADAELPAEDALDEPSGPVLTRDPNEQWETGNRDIDETVEMMREDLRDKGMEDGAEMEAIVMTERARMQEALARDISGDFSQPYQKPDFSELVRGETTDTPVQDISAAQTADTAEITEQAEASDGVADVSQDVDYDAIYSSIDDYDFDGIDYSYDANRLDASLESFQEENWEKLSLDEQKAAMNDLADYVKDAIGLENPPDIVYYNNPVDGDYGGYTYETNTLAVNEHMLYDNDEAADTIAHELWHAYQHQRAANPQNARDYQYQYGFEHYIRPEDGGFNAYQEQLVEAEARAFAQQFKDRNVTKGVSDRD